MLMQNFYFQGFVNDVHEYVIFLTFTLFLSFLYKNTFGLEEWSLSLIKERCFLFFIDISLKIKDKFSH